MLIDGSSISTSTLNQASCTMNSKNDGHANFKKVVGQHKLKGQYRLLTRKNQRMHFLVLMGMCILREINLGKYL